MIVIVADPDLVPARAMIVVVVIVNIATTANEAARVVVALNVANAKAAAAAVVVAAEANPFPTQHRSSERRRKMAHLADIV